MNTPENPRYKGPDRSGKVERAPHVETPFQEAVRLATALHRADPNRIYQGFGRYDVFSDTPGVSGVHEVHVDPLDVDQKGTHGFVFPFDEEVEGEQVVGSVRFFIKDGLMHADPTKIWEANAMRALDEEFGPDHVDELGFPEQSGASERFVAESQVLASVQAEWENHFQTAASALALGSVREVLNQIKATYSELLPKELGFDDIDVSALDYDSVIAHVGLAAEHLVISTIHYSEWHDGQNTYNLTTEKDKTGAVTDISFKHAHRMADDMAVTHTIRDWTFTADGEYCAGSYQQLAPFAEYLEDPAQLQMVSAHNKTQMDERIREADLGEDIADTLQIQAGIDLLKDPKHFKILQPVLNKGDVLFPEEESLDQRHEQIDWSGEDDQDIGPHRSL